MRNQRIRIIGGATCSRRRPSRSGLAPAVAQTRDLRQQRCARRHVAHAEHRRVSLQTFTPPTDPGPGGILFAASGEVLALTGYPFPPVNAATPPSSTAGTCTSRACSSPSTTSRFRTVPTSGRATVCTGARGREVDRPLGDRPRAQRSDLPSGQRRPGRGGGAHRGAQDPEQRPATTRPSTPTAPRYAFGFDVGARDGGRAEREPRRAGLPTTSRWSPTAAPCSTSAPPPSRAARFLHGATTPERYYAADIRELARPDGQLPPLLQVADDLRQLPEPRQRSGAPLPGEEHERGIAFLATNRSSGKSPFTPITRSGTACSTTRPRTSTSSPRAWSGDRAERRVRR